MQQQLYVGEFKTRHKRAKTSPFTQRYYRLISDPDEIQLFKYHKFLYKGI